MVSDPTKSTDDRSIAERIDTDVRPDVLPEKLIDFEAYWKSIVDPEIGMPRKSNFDLIHIAPLMSHIAILDVHRSDDGKNRYKFRFAGTWHRENFFMELTGHFVDTLRQDDPLDAVNEVYREIEQTSDLHYWRRHSIVEGREYMTYHRLMGPLADDDGTVVQLVGCFVRD